MEMQFVWRTGVVGVSEDSDAELCLSQPFSLHLELTATVISGVSKNPGGWGQKFLDKSFHNSKPIHSLDQDNSCKSECSNNSAMSPTPSSVGCAFDDQSPPGEGLGSCHLNCKRPGEGLGSCHLNCKRQCKTSITALVPTDIHGLPKIKSSGPSPLIERWRLGGSCDCGGWDMGCALTLLHNRKQRRNNDLIETNSKAEDCYSSYVLSKGEMEDTPALKMTAGADVGTKSKRKDSWVPWGRAGRISNLLPKAKENSPGHLGDEQGGYQIYS